MFGDRLRELRKSNGLMQKELSESINVSASTIGMYERGFRHPDHETLVNIASYFGVSTDYLLGNHDQCSCTSRIAELRKEMNLSQEELSEMLGVSQQTISKYENGRNEPGSETLILMSKLFGVSIDYIIGNPNIIAGHECHDISRGVHGLLVNKGVINPGEVFTPTLEKYVLDLLDKAIDISKMNKWDSYC